MEKSPIFGPVALPVVLCVDDEPSLLRSLKQELDLGLNGVALIETAMSGEEALEVLADQRETDSPVVVMITDQLMPGLKGDELVVSVRRSDPEVRSILLTGQASADAVGRALNQGGLFRFFSKPWDAALLREAVLQGMARYAEARAQRQHLRQLQQAHACLQQLIAAETLPALSEALATALAPDVQALWVRLDDQVLHATAGTHTWLAADAVAPPAHTLSFDLGGGVRLWVAPLAAAEPELLALLQPQLPHLLQHRRQLAQLQQALGQRAGGP